jgi:alpha/beta superfamily hydrolase
VPSTGTGETLASPEGGATAVLHDQVLGIVDRVGFFPGPDGERLFGSTCLSTEGRSEAAVLVCSPICADADANYRREVVLARQLASRGCAVQRFHYRGTGNSNGDAAAMSFEGLVADACASLEQLRRVAATDLPVVIVGTRFGALVAAAVAAACGGPAALVLWEPFLEPAGFYREASRVARTRAVAKGPGAEHSSPDLRAALEAGAPAHVLGYRLDPSLYRSSQGVTLAGALQGITCPTLLVQFGGGPDVRPGLERLAAAGGRDTEVVVAACEEMWWFGSTLMLPVEPVVEPTTAWIGGLRLGGHDPHRRGTPVTS